MQKSHQKMVNPIDIAGNAEEEEEEPFNMGDKSSFKSLCHQTGQGGDNPLGNVAEGGGGGGLDEGEGCL